MRMILAGLATIILSGCYQSQEPLFTTTNGQCPIHETAQLGMAVVTVASDDGRRTPITVEPTQNGECLLRSPGGGVRLTFVETSTDRWLVQAAPDEALRTQLSVSEPFLYALVRKERGVWLATAPPCGEDWLSELEQEFRVSVRDQAGRKICTIPTGADFIMAMRVLVQEQFVPLLIFEPA
jgi:hypothetical protein